MASHDPSPDRTGPPPELDRRGKMALLVEDDDLHVDVLETLLRSVGFMVLRATTQSEAACFVALTEVDLIVSDLLLPDAHPAKSLYALLALETEAPIMVVSSWSGQIGAHIATGGSRLRLFDKARFDGGEFLAVARYLTSEAYRQSERTTPFPRHGSPWTSVSG